MGLEQLIVRLNPDVPPTGSDLGIVNAARRSFNKRSEWAEDGTLRPADVRLLQFLARGMQAADFDKFKADVLHSSARFDRLTDLLWQWRNTPTHDTPINHGFFSFEVAAPIFVRAQLVKHEYLIMSEFSRRYITDDVEFYEHDYRAAATDKKQGSGGPHYDAGLWLYAARQHNLDSINIYNDMIADGVAPEQARGVLPQDLMTAWTFSGTFGAFAKMCQLRLGSEVQAETRYIAEQVYEHLRKQFPVAAPLFIHGG
jgi:thymidylate synthase (FAD)